MRKVPLPHWASNPFWSSLQSSKLSIWGSKREVTGEQHAKGDPRAYELSRLASIAINEELACRLFLIFLSLLSETRMPALSSIQIPTNSVYKL